jgi:hypothetical protein
MEGKLTLRRSRQVATCKKMELKLTQMELFVQFKFYVYVGKNISIYLKIRQK